jgi:ribosomal protein L16 Arg81 hydroxylase
MVRLNQLDISQNSFSFNLQTSSGDKISLSMYDNKELESDFTKDNSSRRLSMSLRHEFGYSFSYSGNGIDENDKKEIEKAMKLIRQMFHKFLENIRKSDKLIDKRDLIHLSNHFKSLMPKPKNDDMKNMLKDETTKNMDDILSIFKQNDKLVQNTKKLFDKIFDDFDKFEMYA